MVMLEEPDIVCFLRKCGSLEYLGPGRKHGAEAAELIRRGYDVVGMRRDGSKFVSESSWLSTVVNLVDMEDGVYFCSKEQYKSRKTDNS